jgi:protein SCO1
MTRMKLLLIATLALLLCAGRAEAAPKGSPWNETYFPNVTLVDQDGNKQRFYDDLLKDKVVLINFIFATCHDSCPLETAKLRQVQERLSNHVGRDMFMYSISITPETDTPEVLKDYASKFNVGPGWKFLTGNADDITLIRKKLGLMDDEKREEGEGHGMSLIVGNERTGVWIKRSSFDNPKVLARVMSERLLNFASRNNTGNYAQAPVQINLDPGEDLFRRRCQDCHTVGAGDAIGPDLEGVTERREREWLARFIQNPNAMIQAKDPIANALFEKYRRLTMPQMGLSDSDVEHVMAYLKAQSRKINSVAATETAKQADANDAAHAHSGHHHH